MVSRVRFPDEPPNNRFLFQESGCFFIFKLHEKRDFAENREIDIQTGKRREPAAGLAENDFDIKKTIEKN